MFALLIALLTISVASYVWLFYRHVKRFPKGPTPLPIIGNLLSINLRKLHEDFDRISKDYGDIFTVWLPRPCVVVMNHESIKEAFTKKGDDFSGRMGLFPDTLFQNVENGGIIFSQGENWKEQRRTSLHILRDFGMGKNKMEEQVCLSAQEFLAYLNAVEDKSEIDLRKPIQVGGSILLPLLMTAEENS
ncbi:unnamed protein product [Heligmosomoides polygyrus]|uniref:Cytochrome P450 n=1 Tax=Heligmosomoides polygyrus TaxID=6339 RepID=A0A183FLH2_HELPZ|nr:unnamed protein product [Heligmosomoides polygyrus]